MRIVGKVNFPSGNSSAIAAGDGGSLSRLQPAQAVRAEQRKNPSNPPLGTLSNEGQ